MLGDKTWSAVSVLDHPKDVWLGKDHYVFIFRTKFWKTFVYDFVDLCHMIVTLKQEKDG